VARDVSSEAVEEVFSDEGIDEEAAIDRVASKKLKALAKLEPDVRRRRLYAFLARRGYDLDDIGRAMRRLLGPDAEV
ncbi:MAG: regulatory protein RecX, partial [bacterium]